MKNERQRLKELELLSAYLDDELRPAQGQALAARLQQEPDLQDQLDKLRKTKLMVGYLSRLSAPRNYTLTPDMVTVRSTKKQPFVGTMRLASALAAVLLVVLFGVEFLFTSGPITPRMLASQPVMEEAAMVSDDAEPEPLIVWAQPGVGGAESYVPGQGGGVDLMEAPMVTEAERVELERIVEAEIAIQEEPMPLPEAEQEFMLEAEALPAEEEQVESLQAAPDAEKQIPILGINPEEGGEIINRSGDTLGVQTAQPAWRLILRGLQIALGAVAIGGGLAWWLLKRQG